MSTSRQFASAAHAIIGTAVLPVIFAFAASLGGVAGAPAVTSADPPDTNWVVTGTSALTSTDTNW